MLDYAHSFGDTFHQVVLVKPVHSKLKKTPQALPLVASALIAEDRIRGEGTLYNSLPINTVRLIKVSTSFVLATSATLRAVGLMNPVAKMPDGNPPAPGEILRRLRSIQILHLISIQRTESISNKIDLTRWVRMKLACFGFHFRSRDKKSSLTIPTYVSAWTSSGFVPERTLHFPSASRS